MTLYIEVSRDKYELPVIVADTIEELARLAGTTENCIHSAISKEKHGAIKSAKYKRVVIEEED